MSLKNGPKLPGETHTVTIEYPQELLWALQQGPEEFAAQAQILLAVKLYETGKLSTGLAARVAGVPRSTFFYLLGQHKLSPFGQSSDELEDDLTDARAARHNQ
jgi:predicted HTH domain antitoxin